MQKIICKKVYDTETAEVEKKFTYGAFGDEDGYEETLYVTPEGLYFVYENGGKNSIHPEESIKRVAKSAVNDWINNH